VGQQANLRVAFTYYLLQGCDLPVAFGHGLVQVDDLPSRSVAAWLRETICASHPDTAFLECSDLPLALRDAFCRASMLETPSRSKRS